MATMTMGLEFNVGRKFSRGDVLEIPANASETHADYLQLGRPRKPITLIFERDVEIPAGNHILNVEIDTENSHVVSCEQYDAPSEQRPAMRDFLLRVYTMFPNLRGASFDEVINIFEEHYVKVQTTVDYMKTNISFELTPGQYEFLLKVTTQKIVQ